MAKTFSINNYNNNEVLFEEREGVRKIILNRPTLSNCLNYKMISQMVNILGVDEKDPGIRLVILKGNGRAFCSGGDVKALRSYVTQGHWRFGVLYKWKLLTLLYMLRTCNKPVVSILDGYVMGAGAGLSAYSPFRIVTENTVFCMPEAGWGHFPDSGASHFLSRLPGFFGEYIGLTGVYLDGAELLSCGLATHFVPSKDLDTMEEALERLIASGNGDVPNISKIINKFNRKVDLRKDSICSRFEIINNYFSPDTVEEILSLLEKSAAANNKENWMIDAIKSIKLSSPISLKLFLRLIREGRKRNYEECLVSEFRCFCHKMRGTVDNDFFEGCQAKFIVKDRTPQWRASRLELVTNEMMEKYFSEVDDDDDWKPLQLPQRSSPTILASSHL